MATINGNDNINSLDGTIFDDTINAFGGDDRVDGFSGDDLIRGGNGRDVLIGGLGDDVLDGGAGTDRMLGGTGKDTYVGGAGSDTVILDGAFSFEVDLQIFGTSATVGGVTYQNVGSAVGIGGDGEVLVEIENVVVGNNRDATLRGSSVANALSGGGGDDRIEGRGGDDALTGFGGDDEAIGAEGSDRLIGLDGADRLFGGSGTDTLEGGAGNDLLDGGANDDLLEGGAGADTIRGGGGFDTATYRGASAGIDMGTEGDTLVDIDRVEGSSFNDRLIGTANDDRLAGGSGSDRLEGGAGNDTYEFQAFTAAVVDRIIDSGGAADRMIADLGNLVNATRGTSGSSIAGGSDLVLTFSPSNGFGSDQTVIVQGFFQAGVSSAGGRIESVFDTSTGTTVTLAALLVGGEAPGIIAGTAKGETIDGKGGDDLLFGNRGRDLVLGGAGDDRLDGGRGGDLLEGGAGSDVFVIGTKAGHDTIRDFSHGNDRLDLSVFGFDEAGDVLAKARLDGKGDLVLALGRGSAVTLSGLGLGDLGPGDLIL